MQFVNNKPVSQYYYEDSHLTTMSQDRAVGASLTFDLSPNKGEGHLRYTLTGD